MYWKTESLDNPGWRRDTVIDHISPFRSGHAERPEGDLGAYCRFYGLDLWIEHPDVLYTVGFLRSGSHHIATQHYRRPQSQGTIFVLHGYFDHAGLFSQLIDHCLHAGFDVVIYDQPGHGLSSGAPAAITDFSEYQHVLADIMDAVATHAPGPWLAVGQSTGGGVLVDYLLQAIPSGTCRLAHVVLLAPLIRPTGWIGIKMLHSIARPFVKSWGRMFSENSGNKRFLYFLREQDPLQARAVHGDWISALRRWVPRMEAAAPVVFPVTVVQGEKDMTVDWRHNLRIIHNKFSPVSEHLLPGARHHLVNDAPTLQAIVFNTIIGAFSETSNVPPATRVADSVLSD